MLKVEHCVENIVDLVSLQVIRVTPPMLLNHSAAHLINYFLIGKRLQRCPVIGAAPVVDEVPLIAALQSRIESRHLAKFALSEVRASVPVDSCMILPLLDQRMVREELII